MKKPTKFILNTFDYELFLGEKSGNVYECLIEPTNKVVEVLNKFHLQGIFFVDTTYLLQLKANLHIDKLRSDFESIKTQLQYLINNNHCIFLHLHPHWLDAKYSKETGQWNLTDSNKYKLSDLPHSEQIDLFEKSIKLLNDIIHSTGKKQPLDSYRAGGWSLQPFDAFKPHFEKHQIVNDFSVMPGIYQFSSSQSFDYSLCKERSPYNFNSDVNIAHQNGNFTEFPISTVSHSDTTLLKHKILLKYLAKIKKDTSFNRGLGQNATDLPLKPAVFTGKTLSENIEYLSLDFLSAAKIKTYKKYIISNSYIHFLSHPKLLTTHAIMQFENLLKNISDSFEIESDYHHIKTHYTA